MELNPDVFLKLLSADELRAAAWTVAAVTAVTQSFKVVFRRAVMDPDRRTLWIISMATSVAVAVMLWPPASSVHPVVAGVVIGPATNMAFWGAAAPLKRFAPALWAVLNFDRRRRRRQPPGNIERRES